jgi:hypothetical protein
MKREKGKNVEGTDSLSVLGLVGEDEDDDEGADDRSDSLDDEEPPPALDTVSAVKLEDGDSEETSKCVSGLGSRVEDGDPEGQLLLGIPGWGKEKEEDRCQLSRS